MTKDDSKPGVKSGVVWETILICISRFLCIITFPFSLMFCLKTINQYQLGVVLRCGRLRDKIAIRHPGLTIILPCVDTMHYIDMRTKSVDLSNQEVITKDHVTIGLSAVINYRVRWPVRTVTKIERVHKSTHWLAQAVVGQVCGKRIIKDILTERDQMADEILSILAEPTHDWGIAVEKVTIKEIYLPEDIQRSLAAKAEADRAAKALVLAAEGELRSAIAIKAAADELIKSPIAIQLRLMQTFNTVASRRSDTYTFPLPMNMIRHIGDTYIKKIIDYNAKKKSQQRKIMPKSEPEQRKTEETRPPKEASLPDDSVEDEQSNKASEPKEEIEINQQTCELM